MEIRVNVAILVTLGLIWAGLTHTDPVAALDPQAAETAELASLEDAFAHDRGDLALAEELAEQYLWLNQPGLAVGALRSADPTLLDDDPMLPEGRRLSEIRLSPDVVFGVRPFAPPLPVS